MADATNLFADLAEADLSGEVITEVLARPGMRIERIVSTGQASPPGFRYDQDWDEWVAVLAGAARLRFESEPEDRHLGPGVPAHARHRVEWTSAEPPTIWLAVHCKP